MKIKRRLNLRFLALLVGLGAVAGVSVFALHRFQVRRQSAGLLAEATRAQAEGRLDQAGEDLERYLAYRPNDAEALARLGALMDDRAGSEAERTQALTVLEKALALEPDRTESRRRAARLAADLRRYAEARQYLGWLPDDDAATAWTRGRCVEAEGEALEAARGLADAVRAKYAEAADWYDKAIAAEPGRIEVAVRAAGLARGRLEDPDRADRIMDAMVAAGDSSRARLERARYRAEHGLPGAEEDVARALELAPDEAAAILAAAASARRRGDDSAARDLLRRGADGHPKDARMYRALADLELQLGQVDAALAQLERAIEAEPGDRDLQWSAAELMIRADRGPAAEALIERLRQAAYPSEMLDYLRAILLVDQEQWARAAELLERTQAALTGHPELAPLAKRSLVLLGRCYEQLGDADRRLAACRRAVALAPPDDPLRVQASLNLASALSALGRADEALEQCRLVMDDAPEVKLLAVRLLIDRNLRLPENRRRWPEVLRLLDDLKAGEGPGPEREPLLRAEILAAQAPPKLDEAHAALEAARDAHPDRVEYRVALASLARRRGDKARASALLEEAERDLGDRPELRLARARAIVEDAPDGASEALDRLEQDLDRFDAEARRNFRIDLAEAHARIGDTAGVARLWGRIAEDEPNNLAARLVLFDLASLAGDDAEMTRLVAEARRIEGEGGVFGGYAEALRLIRLARSGQADAASRARALLDDIIKRRPDWSRAVRLRADLAILGRDPDAAIADYLRAIELGERDPAAIAQAVQLLAGQKRFAEADQVLRRLNQGQGPQDLRLRRLAAGLAIQMRSYGRAIDLARQAVAGDPKDPGGLTWEGGILLGAARQAESEGSAKEADALRTEADQVLRRAVNLAGDALEPRVLLIRHLVEAGRTAAAEAEVRALEGQPTGRSNPLVLARCRELVGQDPDALYRAALEAKPDDPETLRAVADYDLRKGRYDSANDLLTRLVGLEGMTLADQARVRLVQALILGVKGDSRRSLQVLEDLDRYAAASAAVDPAHLRLRARVLALQADRKHQERAIEILVPLASGESASAEDLSLLAQLLEADGNWPAARDRLRSLLEREGRDPRYLASAAQALLRHGELDEAGATIDKLEQVAPESAATIGARVRLLAARGEHAKAIDRVRAYAGQDRARVLPAAQLLEELAPADRARYDGAAEALYRDLASRSEQPGETLLLADFLGRHGKTLEALTLCEAARAKAPVEAVAATTVAALNASTAAALPYRETGAWLEEAVAKHPESAPLPVLLAVLRSLEGRYPEAEAIYREAIEADGRNVPALNNLAWLLALKLEKADEAEALIQRAIEIAGPIPDLRDTRAVVRLAMGRPDLARADLEENVAATARPIDYFHLVRAYQMAGDPRAKEAFRKARDRGLSTHLVDALERPAYDRLVDALADGDESR